MALHEARLLLPLSGRAAVLMNLSDPGQILGSRGLAVTSTSPGPLVRPCLSACRPCLESLTRATNQVRSNLMLLLLREATSSQPQLRVNRR